MGGVCSPSDRTKWRSSASACTKWRGVAPHPTSVTTGSTRTPVAAQNASMRCASALANSRNCANVNGSLAPEAPRCEDADEKKPLVLIRPVFRLEFTTVLLYTEIQPPARENHHSFSPLRGEWSGSVFQPSSSSYFSRLTCLLSLSAGSPARVLQRLHVRATELDGPELLRQLVLGRLGLGRRCRHVLPVTFVLTRTAVVVV